MDERQAVAILDTDGTLAADIRPRRSATPAGATLLTGATGYLGRHLLRQLLLQDESEVYCLARSSEQASAAARVELALKSTPQCEAWRGRLKILEADLSRPDLGLTPQRYGALSRAVATIVHCAADVSWSRGYEKLRGMNVVPVAQLLRLACERQAKHFVLISSMAVCYSTDATLYTSERADPAQHLARMPLGYAQSKAVAERLVRQAAARGLPTSIFRPALIAGHTLGGHANTADFVAWMVSGCVQLGYAPDVDWLLDFVPVDYVAAVIGANLAPPTGLKTLHISHPRPRGWRELVLFLNLYGCRVRLESFDAWRERLFRHPDPQLPLKRFLAFFGERPQGCGGLTVSQIYEAGGRPRISSRESAAWLTRQGLPFPRLDARFFCAYLDALVQAGMMPHLRAPGAPRRERCAVPDRAVLRALEPLAPASRTRMARLRPAPFEPQGSILAEITSWRHGGHLGLYGVASGERTRRADLVLKIVALENETVTTAIAVADACNRRLGALFERYQEQLEFLGAGERELAIYRSRVPAVAERAPRCLAAGREPASGRTMLLLERLTDVELLDAVDQPQCWHSTHIATAVHDLAAIHAAGYGRDVQAIVGSHAVRRLCGNGIVSALPLWESLYDYTRPFLEQCGGETLAVRVGTLVATLPEWAPRYAAKTSTLVHNDCNPRNLAFRRSGHALRTCLYDWELCAIAPPQRDLAELLCFTVPAAEAATRGPGFLALHRMELERETGRVIDPESWQEGFRLALAEFMLRRLSLYGMLHMHVPQGYLPRVVRCWQALDCAVGAAA